MRYLFLITHYHPLVYGAELFAQKLAEHLVSQGHQVDLITGRWHSDWPTTEIINGVQVYRVDSPHIRYLQTIGFIWPQYQLAQKLIYSHDYDVVHAHIFPSLITGAFLKTSAQKVVTIQGGDLADYPEIYGPLMPFIKPVIAASLKRYSQIHAVSQDLAKQIKRLSGKTSQVIANGVDSELTQQDTYTLDFDIVKKLPDTKLLIFSSSRLTPKNNLAALIQSIRIVRDYGHDVGLAIAGTGHLKAQLSQLIADQNLSKKVVLLGHCSHDQVIALTQHSHVFARISLKEGFGISVLEALSLGTPTVTSQAGGLADFVSPDYCYIPTQSDEPQSIAQTIITALSDPMVYKKTATARKLVQKHYTWEKLLPKFTQTVYKKSND